MLLLLSILFFLSQSMMSQTPWIREDSVSLFSLLLFYPFLFSKLLNSATYLLLFLSLLSFFSLFFYFLFSKLLNSATQPRADVLQGFSAHSWELEEKLRRKKTISGIISRQSNLPSIHILWWEKASWLEVLCVWFLSFWIVRLLVGTWCAAPG